MDRLYMLFPLETGTYSLSSSIKDKWITFYIKQLWHQTVTKIPISWNLAHRLILLLHNHTFIRQCSKIYRCKCSNITCSQSRSSSRLAAVAEAGRRPTGAARRGARPQREKDAVREVAMVTAPHAHHTDRTHAASRHATYPGWMETGQAARVQRD